MPQLLVLDVTKDGFVGEVLLVPRGGSHPGIELRHHLVEDLGVLAAELPDHLEFGRRQPEQLECVVGVELVSRRRR